jgi:hypothetical protein
VFVRSFSKRVVWIVVSFKHLSLVFFFSFAVEAHFSPKTNHKSFINRKDNFVKKKKREENETLLFHNNAKENKETDTERKKR